MRFPVGLFAYLISEHAILIEQLAFSCACVSTPKVLFKKNSENYSDNKYTFLRIAKISSLKSLFAKLNFRIKFAGHSSQKTDWYDGLKVLAR